MQDDLVKTYLKNQEWQFSELSDEIITFGISGENGQFQCVVNSDDENELLNFYTIYGSNIPENKLSEVLSYINGLNVNLNLGNFELDYNEMELRYKLSISHKYYDLNLDIIDEIFMTGIIIMDKNLPVLSDLLHNDLPIDDAVEQTLDAISK